MRARVRVARDFAPILVADSAAACGGQPVGSASGSAGRPLGPVPEARAGTATGQPVRGIGSQGGGDGEAHGGSARGNARRQPALPIPSAATTAVDGPMRAEGMRVGEPVRQPTAAQAAVPVVSDTNAFVGAVERCDTRREALPDGARMVELPRRLRGLPRWSAAGQDGRDACHFNGPAGAYAGGREGDGTIRDAVAGSRETGCRMDGGP